MRKLLALFTVCALLACGLPAAAPAEIEIPDLIKTGDWDYYLLEDGTACIWNYHGSDEELVIPEELDGIRVTELGRLAFLVRATTKSIVIPDGVRYIGEYAFAMCSALTDIRIPEGVKGIGTGAFQDCRKLESIRIPDSVESIEGNPFTYCCALTEIIISPDHPYLEMKDGVLFSKPDRRLVCYPFTLGNTEYTVPEDTRQIADRAFMYAGRLTRITLPEGLEGIGKEAFCRCDRLPEITVPDSVTKIGEGAFSHNAALKSVTLPESVTEIGEKAFELTSDGKTFTVVPGSFAEQYCMENGFTYTHP